jgi:hypothetical protein
MIKQAWCSALQVDAEAHAVLARFPKSPVSWLERGNPAQLQQALAQAAYLAKRETKVTDDGERNFGCSRAEHLPRTHSAGLMRWVGNFLQATPIL